MYLLRRHFGISAYEAEHVLPSWERSMLIERFIAEHAEGDAGERGAAPSGAPLSRVPEDFA